MFGKKSFKERSENILSIFTKTVEDLEELNTEIKEETQKKMELISSLENEVMINTNLLLDNDTVITKIKSIIS